MKFATFNVNSVNMRLSILLNWLKENNVDAIALQETKTVDDLFPVAAFESIGYQAFFVGQKSYNGVAILVKKSSFSQIELLAKNLPNFPDVQARAIGVRLTEPTGNTILFIGTYFPNGTEVGSSKYLYKLDWMASLARWIRELISRRENIILVGDMNVAPTDNDLWNPEEYKNKVLVTPAERFAFGHLIDQGLIDTWTLEPRNPDQYSWWDYRFEGFAKNHGMRIDHILVTESIVKRYKTLTIDKKPRALEKPSDHTPVVLEIA